MAHPRARSRPAPPARFPRAAGSRARCRRRARRGARASGSSRRRRVEGAVEGHEHERPRIVVRHDHAGPHEAHAMPAASRRVITLRSRIGPARNPAVTGSSPAKDQEAPGASRPCDTPSTVARACSLHQHQVRSIQERPRTARRIRPPRADAPVEGVKARPFRHGGDLGRWCRRHSSRHAGEDPARTMRGHSSLEGPAGRGRCSRAQAIASS